MNRRIALIATVTVCLLVSGAVVIARDALSGFKELDAMGTSLSSSNPSCTASVSTNGELRGNVIGTGTYTLCLNPATLGCQPGMACPKEPAAPAPAAPPAAAPAAPAAAAPAPAASAPAGGTPATVGTLV